MLRLLCFFVLFFSPWSWYFNFIQYFWVVLKIARRGKQYCLYLFQGHCLWLHVNSCIQKTKKNNKNLILWVCSFVSFVSFLSLFSLNIFNRKYSCGGFYSIWSINWFHVIVGEEAAASVVTVSYKTAMRQWQNKLLNY